jgi:uncharacterized protein
MKGIADTGFLVAFASRGDRHHDWALEVVRQITMPLLTCESVLSEVAFHLAELAERYSDRSPDLADLCLVRMSEEYPRYIVITTAENDFRVYRRNKREVIPTLCPPRP